MTVHNVDHPIWGNNLATQIWVKSVHVPAHNEQRTHEYFTWLRKKPKTKVKSVWVKAQHREANDEDCTTRHYRYRCGLICLLLVESDDREVFMAILDGHVGSYLGPEETSFRFSAEDLAKNNGNPIVDIYFRGSGPRQGPLEDYNPYRATFVFADQKQMDQYFDASANHGPESIIYGNTVYKKSNGDYKSSDGSVLPWLLVAYCLLSHDHKHAFAAQHPEVQAMLEEGGEPTVEEEDPEDEDSDDDDDDDEEEDEDD